MGDEGWGWSRIKYEITRMRHVEQNTTIGHNPINKNSIEDS